MKLVNYPSPVPAERYDRAIQKYLDKIKHFDGVIAVFQMGSIQAPGLSDIDLIVVTTDDFPAKLSEKLSIRGIDDALFIHGPLVIPESALSDLQYLIYASGLKLICGQARAPSFDELNPVARKSLELCYILDFTESRLFQFAGQSTTDRLDLRSWLTRIWSSTHTWNLFRHLSETSPEPETIHQIYNMRADWIRNASIAPECFLELFHAARRINESFFSTALEFYTKREGTSPLSGSLFAGDRILTFSNGRSHPTYQIRNYALLNRSLVYCRATHPAIYIRHLSGYGLRYLQPDLSVEPWPGHYAAMQHRASVVRAHWQWREAHVPAAGSMSGYLGFVHRGRSIRQFATRIIHLQREGHPCIF